jgi:hypothetical protein
LRPRKQTELQIIFDFNISGFSLYFDLLGIAHEERHHVFPLSEFITN